MKAFVTGAAGFIGSHLCERLIFDGHEVVGFDDLSNGKITNLDYIIKHPKFHMCLGDVVTGNITDSSMPWKALDDIDWVFHLAAKADIVPSIERPLDYHKTNVNGTIKTIEAARKWKVKKFVYAASSSCYGLAEQFPTPETYPCNPSHPYGLTKLIGESYVMHWGQVYKVPVISLRLFNVYGPRHRTSGAYGAVFGTWLAQLANNKPITVVGDGEQKRDFTYVTDVVDAFIKAAECPEHGMVLNVGSGGTYSVNHLADLLDAKDRVVVERRNGEPEVTFADTARIHEVFGWSPKVSFKEGVGRLRHLIPEYKNAPLWTKEKIEKATEEWHRYMR